MALITKKNSIPLKSKKRRMPKLFQPNSSFSLCKPNHHNWAMAALESESSSNPSHSSSNGPPPAKPHLGPTTSKPPPSHPCSTRSSFPYYLWWHVQFQAQGSVLCEILGFWGWFILILFYFIWWVGSKRDLGRLKREKSKNSRGF